MQLKATPTQLLSKIVQEQDLWSIYVTNMHIVSYLTEDEQGFCGWFSSAAFNP